jgi:N-acetyl-gamma-glutamyl-phosphate reductase
MSISVGVFGATGYTGLELVRLLNQHPGVKLSFVTSESSAGKSLRDSWPQAPDLPLIASIDAPLGDVQAIFLCLPNTQSALVAAKASAQGVLVIDLSADLRLDDPAQYELWYKAPHPAPDLLPAPYGLPELGHRDVIARALYVANPGCYATAMLLGLAPLVKATALQPATPIIVDAKSGTTGAGRTPRQDTLFAEVHGNLSPYNIGRAHRHIPEVEQALSRFGQPPGKLIFSPHLLPTDRGILASIYVQTHDAPAACSLIEAAYHAEPLINVLPSGELATLAHAVRTPRAALSLTPVDDHMLIIMVAIDNLLKGAASQAVQNFNLMMGCPETEGLL